MSYVTAHVLDSVTGTPAQGIAVALEAADGTDGGKIDLADYGGAAQYVDFFMVMTYDFFGAGSQVGHHAGLHGIRHDQIGTMIPECCARIPKTMTLSTPPIRAAVPPP